MRSNYADLDAQPTFVANFGAAVAADAEIVVPADSEQFWAIDWIMWSYDGDAVGQFQVFYAGVKVMEHDITRGGPGLLEFHNQSLYHANEQKMAIKGEELKVVLKGATGATGKLSIRYR